MMESSEGSGVVLDGPKQELVEILRLLVPRSEATRRIDLEPILERQTGQRLFQMIR